MKRSQAVLPFLLFLLAFLIIIALAGSGTASSQSYLPPTGESCGYGTVGICIVPPPLTLTMNVAYWKTLSDYQQGKLTVSFTVGNKFSGFCSYVVGAINSNGVTTVSSFPISLGNLGYSGSTAVQIQYLVPGDVQYFSTRIFATTQNACGLYEYPYHFFS